MEKLSDIMAALTEIEFGMDCLLKMLEALEEIYSLRHEHTAHSNIMVLMRQLSSLHTDLSEEISNIDDFILSNKKRVTE